MKHFKINLLFVILLMGYNYSFSQCATTSNIYSFVYNGHSYEVVKENKSWIDASSCAVNRNGYLAEIDDVNEQNAIFDELTNNAGINISNTQNQFGTASVWLGGSDAGIEGNWIWDGNNDGVGSQFWSGGPTGSNVGGFYTNWGTSPAEPDNSGGQDYLTIIIKPTAVNFGLWNDLISTNTIYYLIEYSTVLSIQDIELKSNISVYPNPFTNFIMIDNGNSIVFERVTLINLLSQEVIEVNPDEIINNEINVSSLDNGIYLLNMYFENGEVISQKVVK